MPGVTSCSVSLLTNSMGVEGTASAAAIVKAVQDAGYGASPKAGGPTAAPDPSADLDALADHETPKLKKAAHRLPSLPSGADVLFHGAHDVGLAAPPLV